MPRGAVLSSSYVQGSFLFCRLDSGSSLAASLLIPKQLGLHIEANGKWRCSRLEMDDGIPTYLLIGIFLPGPPINRENNPTSPPSPLPRNMCLSTVFKPRIRLKHTCHILFCSFCWNCCNIFLRYIHTQLLLFITGFWNNRLVIKRLFKTWKAQNPSIAGLMDWSLYIAFLHSQSTLYNMTH